MFYTFTLLSVPGFMLAGMKQKHSARKPLSSMTTQNTVTAGSSFSAAEVAAQVLFEEKETVEKIHAILHHPRSLARPTAAWRPPVLKLPGVAGQPPLIAAMTRRRVGERVRARVRGFGERRAPAYLLSVRITDPHDREVPAALAEGWIRSLIEPALAGAVHEIEGGGATTYVWLVDSAFNPVHSPNSLFEGFAAAA